MRHNPLRVSLPRPFHTRHLIEFLPFRIVNSWNNPKDSDAELAFLPEGRSAAVGVGEMRLTAFWVILTAALVSKRLRWMM